MVKETKKFDRERSVQSTCFAHFWSVPKGDIGCLLALAGRYKLPTGFCHKPYEVAVEPQSRAPHLLRRGAAINAKKSRKTIEWERLAISSRKLEIPREHFL